MKSLGSVFPGEAIDSAEIATSPTPHRLSHRSRASSSPNSLTGQRNLWSIWKSGTIYETVSLQYVVFVIPEAERRGKNRGDKMQTYAIYVRIASNLNQFLPPENGRKKSLNLQETINKLGKLAFLCLEIGLPGEKALKRASIVGRDLLSLPSQ